MGSLSTREHPGDRPQVFCDLFASRSDSPELDEPYEDVEAEMEALSKVNQELESQAAYVDGKSFSERSQVRNRDQASRSISSIGAGQEVPEASRIDPAKDQGEHAIA